jgi:hypothetical protein
VRLPSAPHPRVPLLPPICTFLRHSLHVLNIYSRSFHARSLPHLSFAYSLSLASFTRPSSNAFQSPQVEGVMQKLYNSTTERYQGLLPEHWDIYSVSCSFFLFLTVSFPWCCVLRRFTFSSPLSSPRFLLLLPLPPRGLAHLDIFALHREFSCLSPDLFVPSNDPLAFSLLNAQELTAPIPR